MELLDVLRSGNCSGCGACVLAGTASRMALDDRGDLRPIASASRDTGRLPALDDYCPAVIVRRPSAVEGANVDPDFGAWVGVWAGHAADEATRWEGSSGGVLTAISTYLLDTGAAVGVTMVRGKAASIESEAFVARNAQAALSGASSRYAPASTLASLANQEEPSSAVVARPCEASALRALDANQDDGRLILSFFCAGVPSQRATRDMVSHLGSDVQSVQSLRYRGRGWPGLFTLTDSSGVTRVATYEDSWGQVLGRDVQSRCKICVDGVGESADVVAADYWDSDEKGYPKFSEAPGRSLIIARTHRGRELVLAAQAAGYLVLGPAELDFVRAAQQLQVNRRQYLLGRLAGRRLAGLSNPKFAGFELWARALRSPLESIRQARGSFARARKLNRPT